jgi:hypothetical protein
MVNCSCHEGSEYDIGNLLNKAIAAIEDENDSLQGAQKQHQFQCRKGKTKIPIRSGKTSSTTQQPDSSS